MEQLEIKNMKNISMSDNLETLVADYLENFGLEKTNSPQETPAAPIVEVAETPAPKKRKTVKKNDK